MSARQTPKTHCPKTHRPLRIASVEARQAMAIRDRHHKTFAATNDTLDAVPSVFFGGPTAG